MKTQQTTNGTRLSRWCGLWVGLFGLISLSSVSAFAQVSPTIPNNSVLFPPHTRANGATQAEWAARYWQWAHAFPATADPANDTAPLSAGQSGPVWFLPSVRGNATVTRHATVPAGVSLFSPVLSTFVNNADCPQNTTLTREELSEGANGAWDFAARITSVTIDGVPMAGLDNPQTTPYRAETDLFYVTVASHDNILAATGTPCFPDGGTIDYVAVGAWVMIKPLPVGQHVIRLVGAAGPPGGGSFFFVKDITYVLTVTP